MLKWLKSLWPALPTPLELAVAELVQAERALLESVSAAEYASALCTYNEMRIARLKEYVVKASI